MSLPALPDTILERIAYHIVVDEDDHEQREPTATTTGPDAAYLYTPPHDSTLPPCLLVGIARLPPFLSVSKAIYEALSPGYAVSASNGDAYPLRTELYARLCAEFLDVKAAGRRWRHARRRKGAGEAGEGTWDRDVGGVTNEGLTAHFVLAVRTLRFFKRAAMSIGIPLPPQTSPSSSSLESKPAETSPSPLYDEAIEQTLLTAFILMLENDGKNHHQLRLVSAPQFVDMLVFHRLNEDTGANPSTPEMSAGPQVKFNDGWPVENVLNTAAVWCVWLFTTEEKVQSESLPVREALIRLVLPFVLCPYRYASALVPPTHYTLPLPASIEDLEDVYQKPLSTHTAHGQFPVYHSFPANAVPPPPAIVPSHSRAPTPPTPTPAPPAPQAAAPPAPAPTPTLTPAQPTQTQNHDPAAEVPSNATRADAAPTPSLTDRPGGGGGPGEGESNPSTPSDNSSDEAGANRDHDEDAGASSSTAQAPDAAADARTPTRLPPIEQAPVPVPNHDDDPPPHPPPAPNANANVNVNTNPPPPATANPNANAAPAAAATASPRSSPVPPPPPHSIHISRRPTASPSNSQAHPSFGVSVPWYCSPGKEGGVHQHLAVPSTSSINANPYSPSMLGGFNVVPRPSSSPKSITTNHSGTHVPSSTSPYRALNTPKGITLHLPLISAAAKLVFMSRREAVPLPVIPSLPVNREAARAAGWRWAGPTQEDLKEMGGWCSWGRREIWPERSVGSDGAQPGEEEGRVEDEVVTAEDVAAQPEATQARPVKVEERPVWYTDSQRWDVDWWRMRLCGGTEWQNKRTVPNSLFSPFPFPTSTPSPPLFKQPHETLAYRTGRVYERGMLTGLWQGYMHMPNEASLNYVANTRQFPSNFGEQALGVMMRPVLVRLAEHTWVARPGDPGPFVDGVRSGSGYEKGGKGKGKVGGKRYWEKSMLSEENVVVGGEEEGYEYLEPTGEGPVPIAKPTTMTKLLAVPHNYAMAKTITIVDPMPNLARVGFLDENMNNAWLPGPVGSFRWDAGSSVTTTTTTTIVEGTTRQANAEEGVEDGVWRDRYVALGDGEGRLKMRSVTFCIPGTFERGEGVEVTPGPPPGPAPAPGAAAAPPPPPQPVQGGVVAVPAPHLTPPTPVPGASAGSSANDAPRIVTRLDNPNVPLPVPNPDAPSSSPVQRMQRRAVPPTRHVYETYDPCGVREGVHERMERAKGEPCRGLRRHKASGEVKAYVYPHPGCLKCREREGVLRKQREMTVRARRERKTMEEERRVLEGLRAKMVAAAVRTEEVQEMFRSVGLGLGEKGGDGEDEDEDEEMRVEEFGMDGEDVGQSEVDEEGADEEWETDSDEEDEVSRKQGFCDCGLCKHSGRASEQSDREDSEDGGDFEDGDTFSDLSDDDDLDFGDSAALSSSFPPCTPSSSPSDVVITGSMDERHSEAWGNFAYYGRVRPWDGLVGLLRIGTRDENVGNRFFFYGYVYGGRNFVGNWRYAVTDAVSPGMESSFVLTRRGEV